MPAVVWTCITQCASGMPRWIAAWTVKPAGLTGQRDGAAAFSTTRPSTSIRTRLDAVTSL